MVHATARYRKHLPIALAPRPSASKAPSACEPNPDNREILVLNVYWKWLEMNVILVVAHWIVETKKLQPFGARCRQRWHKRKLHAGGPNAETTTVYAVCSWKHSINVWSQNGRRFDHVHLQVAALVEITKKSKERRRADRMFPHIGLEAQSICTNQQYRCPCAHRRRTSERCWFSFREKVGMFTNLTWFSATCCEVNLSYRVSGPSQRTRQGASNCMLWTAQWR